MKRVKANVSFSEYWLYKVWHKKKGRWQANLVLVEDTKERTTISYARYLYSVKLGRNLEPYEHVDHINEDKGDDRIENLQLLTPLENKIKSEKYRNTLSPKLVSINCSYCGNSFNYPSRNFRFHSKRGRTNFHCSKKC